MIVNIFVSTFPIFTSEIQFFFPRFSGHVQVNTDRLVRLGVTGHSSFQENCMNGLLLFSP